MSLRYVNAFAQNYPTRFGNKFLITQGLLKRLHRKFLRKPRSSLRTSFAINWFW